MRACNLKYLYTQMQRLELAFYCAVFECRSFQLQIQTEDSTAPLQQLLSASLFMLYASSRELSVYKYANT